MQSLKTASRMSTSNENLILLNIVQGTLNTLVDSLQLVNSITLEYIIETVIKITMLSVSMILIIKGLSQQDKIITCTLFAAWPNITAAVCGFAQGVACNALSLRNSKKPTHVMLTSSRRLRLGNRYP
jgi:hypothetical protein